MVKPPPVILETHAALHAPLADWYQKWADYAAALGRYHYAKQHAAPDAVIELPTPPEGLTAHPAILPDPPNPPHHAHQTE